MHKSIKKPRFPKASVIILSYYNSEEVSSQVGKLLDFPISNIIVIDNASDEKHLNVLRKLQSKFKNVVLIQNERNNGFAGGINPGFTKAFCEGMDYVLVLTVDVEITKADFIKLLENALDVTNPVLKFQRGKSWVYDFGGRVNWLLGRTTHVEMKTLGVSDSLQIDYVTGACMLVKREVYEKIGGFDERFFMYFEDVDFCLRARRAGFKVEVNKSAVVWHKILEHRTNPNRNKTQLILAANFKFIQKWCPWYFKPLAFSYISILYIWLFVKRV